MDFTCLEITVDDFVATVTMNRPPVNAQNQVFRAELVRAFDMFTERDDVRAVVITGAGKYFSAGADLKERPQLAAEVGAYQASNRLAREFVYTIMDCPKPVISALNGPAMGAGTGIFMAADILLAAEDSWISMPEVDVGLAGGTRMVMRFLPHSTARRMYFTADRISAAELYRMNVIEACLPLPELMPAALAIARRIAAKPPQGVQAAKRSFCTTENLSLKDGYRYEQHITYDLSRTEATKEIHRAFAQKNASKGGTKGENKAGQG